MKKAKFILIPILLLLIVAAVLFLISTIRDFEVRGSDMYTKEEIQDYILSDDLDRYTFYLWIKSRFADQSLIPFIESYEVIPTSLHTVKIVLKKEQISGCIEYMGTYLYFDENGVVRENAGTLLEDVPVITGLDLKYLVVGEKLPIKEDRTLDLLVETAVLLGYYDVSIDEIHMMSSSEIMLRFEDVNVELGTKKDLEAKISDLSDFREQLSGLSGTLDMKSYNESRTGYTFRKESE